MEWKFSIESPWSYRYAHERSIDSKVGTVFSTTARGQRAARLVVEPMSCHQARISLGNIVDTAQTEDSNIERPMGDRMYPLMVIDRAGRIVENFYPGRVTRPLAWTPDLLDLRPGIQRDRHVSVPLKTGFRKVQATGVISTTWSDERGLVRTEFAISTPATTGLFSPSPSTITGHSSYRFDVDAGRVLQGSVHTRLEQTLALFRFREVFKMTLEIEPQ